MGFEGGLPGRRVRGFASRSPVEESGKVRIVSFFGVKIAEKNGGGKSHGFGFSLHCFFEMVRKMEGTRDGSRSNKEKMPFNALRAGIFA